MIIAELTDGIGNQLFQYAHARALSFKLNQELYFDISFFDRYPKIDRYLLDKFNTQVKFAVKHDYIKYKRVYIKNNILRRLNRLIFSTPYIHQKYHFDQEKIDSSSIKLLKQYNNFYVSGYFGDEKYFKDIEDKIRQEITLKNPMNYENGKMLQQIKSTNAVSLHVRRGDYVGNPYFESLPVSYYVKAINFMESRFPGATYYVFSDDKEWVKKNLNIHTDIVFVDFNDRSKDYMDLMLMAACKNNIIANSTFSWWGAWLNNNHDKIVVAPKIWYKNKLAQTKYEKGHLVPSNWIKI